MNLPSRGIPRSDQVPTMDCMPSPLKPISVSYRYIPLLFPSRSIPIRPYEMLNPPILPVFASISPVNLPFLVSMLPSSSILKFPLAVTSPSNCIWSAVSLILLTGLPCSSVSSTLTPIRATLPLASWAYSPAPSGLITSPVSFNASPSLSNTAAEIFTSRSLCSNSVRYL